MKKRKHKPIGPQAPVLVALECQMEKVLTEMRLMNERLERLETPIHHWWDSWKKKRK